MSQDFTLLYLPQEPVENRYNSDWQHWFMEAFNRNKIPVIRIVGEQIFGSKPLANGFCNPLDSMRWKFSQMKMALKAFDMVKDPIVVFIQDGWMPGTEAFAYIKALANRDIKVVSFWHGGSYLRTDILNEKCCEHWSLDSENSWLSIADKIFVGSDYHKKMITGEHEDSINEFCKPYKVIETGCPVDIPKHSIVEELSTREQIVVWPHRIAKDKNPEEFDRLAADPRFKNVTFIKTMEVCQSRAEYYDLLTKAKVAVSTANHETFGISMVEAVLSGCWPVIPNRLSYPEIFGKQFCYNDYEQMAQLVKHHLGKITNYKWDGINPFEPEVVTDCICHEIKGLFE